MDLGPFIFLSLFYAVIGVRVVAQVVQRRRELFDRRFTQADRSLVDQAAFFILVPISVALHELGHAALVRLFGATITDYGFYVFAGFVSYRGVLSDTEQILIALAGPLVNVLLAVAAIAVVFLKRPPLRAAYNELLLQFALLTGINALVFYPLLDVATGLQGGDWSQIYDGGVPALSAVIFAGHAAILAVVWWGWKNTAVMRRVNRLTGVPPGAERGLLGGVRPARPALLQSAPAGTNGAAGGTNGAAGGMGAPSPVYRVLHEAAERVASGWEFPVRHTIQGTPDGPLLTLVWQSDRLVRAILARSLASGPVELFGATAVEPPPGQGQVQLAARRRLAHFAALPSADELTLALRLAMEEVAVWPQAAA